MKYIDPLLFVVPQKIDIPMIMKAVSKRMDIPVDEMIQKSRKKEFVVARQLSMILAKKFTPYSLAKIGYEVAGKDHATVLHACKQINNYVDTKDPIVLDAYRDLVVHFKKVERQIKEGIPDSNERQAKTIFNTEK